MEESSMTAGKNRKYDDEIVMYIIINSDVKMSKGKAIAQGCHSAVKAYHLAYGEASASVDSGMTLVEWFKGSYTKIILKASEYEMKEILESFPTMCVGTIDEGRTEIKKGTLTSIAVIPMKKFLVPESIKKLRLM